MYRKCRPLWHCEEITPRVFTIKSAEQMETFLRHVVRIFQGGTRGAHLEQRWAQVALQLALSCPSRHYAGRSFQVGVDIGSNYWKQTNFNPFTLIANGDHFRIMSVQYFYNTVRVRVLQPDNIKYTDVLLCQIARYK